MYIDKQLSDITQSYSRSFIDFLDPLQAIIYLFVIYLYDLLS